MVLPVFRDSLIGDGPRPVRGVLNVLAMAAVGVALVWIYQRVGGLTSPPVTVGSGALRGLLGEIARRGDSAQAWPLLDAATSGAPNDPTGSAIMPLTWSG